MASFDHTVCFVKHKELQRPDFFSQIVILTKAVKKKGLGKNRDTNIFKNIPESAGGSH
jgi:hypothetical protein